MPIMSSQTLAAQGRLTIPHWRRRPCRAPKAVRLTEDELLDKMDAYFQPLFDAGKHPTFCDLAGQTGFDSITQMVNHARRKGSGVMRGVSRALLAVGAGYEEQAQEGSRTALAMLEHLPQFDTEDPQEQVPLQPFKPRQEMQVHIAGLADPAKQGQQLTEQEAYLQLIRHKTYQEVEASAAVMDLEQAADGSYSVLEIGDD